MKMGEDKLKPLGWAGSLAAFIWVALMLFLAHYWFIPKFLKASGQPYLVGYLIAWVGTMAVISCASLVMFHREGREWTWSAFACRYRLAQMPLQDWAWTILVILVAAGIYALLQPTTLWLGASRFLAPHPAVPADLGPGGTANLNSGTLFGMELKGQWWVVIVYFLGWILNIFGEEFWYRGWMLPRQELAFGRVAWLINGVIFTFQHTFQPWNYLAILPGALFAVFIAQHRRNTWITIIQHGLMNLILLLFVIQGVLG